MFDLEKSIAQWRQQMRAAGLKTAVPLEELELHLREDFERLAQSGMGQDTAFATAVRQLGPPQALKGEFRKNGIRSNVKFGIFTLIGCSILIARVLYVHYHTGPAWKGDQLGWIVLAAITSIWAVAGVLFNLSMGGVREVRVWKLSAIIYSSISMWATVVSVLQIFLNPRISAAVGVTNHLLAFAAVAVSFLSVFAWQRCLKVLPIVHRPLIRAFLGVVACITGSGLVSLLFWFSGPLGQLPLPTVYVLFAWANTIMAILAGAGYGLAEAARRKDTVIAA